MTRVNRKKVKCAGKSAFLSNRSEYVLAGAILVVVSALVATFAGNVFQIPIAAASAGVRTYLWLIADYALQGLVVTAVSVLVAAPVRIGVWRFCLGSNRQVPKTTALTSIASGFRTRYADSVVAILQVEYTVFLWSLLFLVPGVIKLYSYRLVPALIADGVAQKPEQILKLSEETMNGHRMEAFILDLSFAGWAILSVFTGGLLGVLFVVPYKMAADAEFYRVLAERGSTSPEIWPDEAEELDCR